jgi:hypothetical protein
LFSKQPCSSVDPVHPQSEIELTSAILNPATNISDFGPFDRAFVRGKRNHQASTGRAWTEDELKQDTCEHLAKGAYLERNLAAASVGNNFSALPEGLQHCATTIGSAYQERKLRTEGSEAHVDLEKDLQELCRNTVYGVRWGKTSNMSMASKVFV